MFESYYWKTACDLLALPVSVFKQLSWDLQGSGEVLRTLRDYTLFIRAVTYF